MSQKQYKACFKMTKETVNLVKFTWWQLSDKSTPTTKHEERKKVKSFSRVWLFVTLWTVAYQASLSKRFSRQEYWSGWPLPSPGDLPHPGINPGILHCRQTLYHLRHQGSNIIPGSQIEMWNGLYEKYPAIVVYLLNPKLNLLKNERIIFSSFTEREPDSILS